MIDGLRSYLKHQGIVIAFLGLGAAVAATPLQHYVSMARYQHWGLAVFIFGLGYIIQLVWSWRHLGLWTRLSMFWSGLYISSAGMIFYANPWLDTRFAVETAGQEEFRQKLIYIFAGMTAPAILFWQRSYQEFKRSCGDKQSKAG